MFSLKQLSIATVGTMAVGLGSVAPVNAASFYEIVGLDFGSVDINNSAQIVGQNYLWEDGNVTNLNTLPGAEISEEGFSVYATAINNNGAIVGNAYWSDSIGIGFISDGSTISSINCEELCPGGYVTVGDINDSGTIGVTAATGTSLRSITIDSNGTQTNYLNRTIISSINNQGQIVGTDYNDDNPGVYGFFYANDGQLINLNPVAQLDPSSTAPSDRSNANDIDDNGNIVGSSLVSPSPSYENTAQEATLWTDPTQPGVSLGTLGGENSEAFGINNLMQVVGYSYLEDDSTRHAFLWEDGDLIDLNSLIDPASGWVLTSAVEINDSGDIIGIGTYNGVGRGFYAKAVPEPSSVLGVLGLGLFGLSNWRKRKKGY